jgi:predicted PurR-regulated permease PerM
MTDGSAAEPGLVDDTAGLGPEEIGETHPADLAVPDPAEGDELVAPPDHRPDTRQALRTPLTQRPTVRAGAYAWALIGMAIIALAFGFLVALLSSVIIPLVIALFPAAVLQLPTDWLRRRGLPDWAAALLVLLGTIGVISLVVALIAPAFAGQVELLGAAIQDGYRELDVFLRRGPFGLQPIRLQDLIDQIAAQLGGSVDGSAVADNALGFARAFFTTATATLLMLIALFFYLKDGRAIARWVKTVFPVALHDDVDIVGRLCWQTIGGYIQGQLMVAVVDALFIGIGLWVLGVELALPLGVIVFFGGLFPIVGATISGFLAAIVTLASNGTGDALLVVVLVLAVQNLEGQLLQPLILGRALQLHPLAIICSLAVGGFLLGILGAFLAVPVAAASAQTIGYLRKRIPG